MADSDTSPNAASLLRIGEAAGRLGVAVDTLRRWQREGRIDAVRTPGGQRRFRIEDVDRLISEDAATPVVPKTA